MNKFEKQLEKWNNGVLRGAQAKLAKTLGVSTATTALWATGKRRPSKGYAAKIATLFKMDIYSVFKLFENKTIFYSTPAQPTQHLLRESASDYLYPSLSNEEDILQSNSVRLPFFSQVPALFPQYNEDDVLEWWSVPRRYACGAKYIVPSLCIGLAHADADDLCFIKPSAEANEPYLVLCKKENGKYSTHAPSQSAKGTIIGTVVRRISTPK